MPTPDYDHAQHSLDAWRNTRALLLGHGPRIQTAAIWERYINSMRLLLVALASATVLGL